ncbi:tripartite tricarboxylate transporter substrate binding protein [Verticiella sediminum]|uniref:Tripartite tricarboxylate transporter substrate binding protein n=1 Tax=Verticiella sediminum TaxID=1247510 RepID=A0A556ABB7_9BURK|nr:tripartite tricarboxylate transporter substrate binding protein [Verticiella sediminum]TSH90184.1 tripartite tricarboxylate transporter substrate binding protein [Verticiella sediminum]
MGMFKRVRFAATLGLALGLASPGIQAQTYPSKPIRVIVPSSPGGSPDVLARLIGVPLGEELGQPLVIETIPGAAGIIGTDKAAKATPDGYTLLYGFNQVATMNPPLYKKLPYHPERDLVPLGLTLDLSYMWIANKEFEPDTIDELIALNRAKPGSVDYASTGPGSAAHLGALLLERMTDTQMNHVPYRSNTNSDLMAGVVKLKLDPVAASLGLVRDGRVKVLAVSAPQRLPVLPDVPTVAETVPGYELTGWQGFWAPVGTPPEIVQRLNAAIVKVIHAPQMQERIRQLGYEPLGTTPQEMADRIHRELQQWGGIIQEANLSLDQ